ncbi:hypothetical protein JCM8208_003774 [Rhodotorula glutinis]
MATAPAADPLVACPYTAGGCPLFQTYDVDPNQRCAGSCSPAAPPPPPPPAHAYSPRQPSSATFASTSTANKRAAPSYFTAEDAAFLSELTGEGGASVPLPLAGDDSSWAGYLDFGISPSAFDVPYTGPGPEASSSSMPSPPLDVLPPLPPQLWDLEDLISRTGPGAKRVRTTPPPVVPAPVAIKYPHTDVQVDKPSPPTQGPAAGSPTSTDEDESEVVTPFISKLSYLLQHPEFEPWVRWDSSGQYLLVAHTKPHLLQILERFFRHTVTSSFIRQLNIYGFRRASTAQLLNILDSTSFASVVTLPDGTLETFSAADYSAFGNPLFWRSVPGGPPCRLGALKPITKERGPRNRSKKAQAAAAAAAASTAASTATAPSEEGGGGGGSSRGARKAKPARSGLATPAESPELSSALY